MASLAASPAQPERSDPKAWVLSPLRKGEPALPSEGLAVAAPLLLLGPRSKADKHTAPSGPTPALSSDKTAAGLSSNPGGGGGDSRLTPHGGGGDTGGDGPYSTRDKQETLAACVEPKWRH